MQVNTSDSSTAIEDMRARAAAHRALCVQIREMLIERLDLPVDQEWLTDDQPLFGRGLELDSVDALEISVGISSLFDASIDDDDREAFGSIAKLAERVHDQS